MVVTIRVTKKIVECITSKIGDSDSSKTCIKVFKYVHECVPVIEAVRF